MSGLLPAGSGSLTDLWAPSHVCSLQPSLRRHSSLDVRSLGRKVIDSSDSGLTRRCSQHGQNLLPCLKQQQQRLSSKRCRRPICRAASQPLPSGVHRPCLAAPRQGLRRSNSQSRLESPCRSTLAEPPVREETGGQVIHPEVVDPQKVDYDQEWSAYQRRFQSLKEVTDLTSGLMQAMEEIGSFSQTGFSAHDQAVLQSERLKHDDEQKRKARQREQRRLEEASRRMAAAHQPSASPASRSSAATAPPSRWAAEISFAPAEEPQIDVSHTSVPEAEDIATSSSSSSSPGSSIPDGPSMSLFRRLVPIPQQQQQRVISSSSGKRADRQGSSAAHVTAARRSSRSVGQRSARLKQTAAASKAAETGKPAKKKMLVVDKAFPLPDSFGYMGNNHKLLSADEEKRLAVQIQSILPYEEKFDELHQANMAAAGIAEEGSDRPNAAHPDAEAGKYDPTFREWATACGRADDIPAFEHQIWEGRQARLKMLECNQRLVRSVARHFKNRGVAAEDLIMEGMQGLRRGIDKFDPNKGFKFSTYAHWWIRQAISRSICDQGRVLKVPYHICDLIAKIRKIEREMRANGTKPQPHVVAQKMGISVPRYHEILAGDANMHSLEQPLNTDGDSKSLEDMLEDDGPSMNELVVHGGLISDVNNLLHTLSPREQGVLRLRYGLDGQGERTLDDIGRFFKVTRERVRQVETKALLKLRQPMRSEALIEYTRANTQQLTWGQSGALGKKSS